MSWLTALLRDLFFRDHQLNAELRQQIENQMKTINDLNAAIDAAKLRADALAAANAEQATIITEQEAVIATGAEVLAAKEAAIVDLRAQLAAALDDDFTPQVAAIDTIAA